MHQKEAILKVLGAAKPQLLTQFGVEKIGLFGSISEGRATENSDIDLFYELQDGVRIGLFELFEFQEAVKKLLETERIDLVNLKYMNPVIKHRARAHFAYA